MPAASPESSTSPTTRCPGCCTGGRARPPWICGCRSGSSPFLGAGCASCPGGCWSRSTASRGPCRRGPPGHREVVDCCAGRCAPGPVPLRPGPALPGHGRPDGPGVEYLEGAVPGGAAGRPGRLPAGGDAARRPGRRSRSVAGLHLYAVPGLRPRGHRPHPYPGAGPRAAGVGALPPPRGGLRPPAGRRGLAGGGSGGRAPAARAGRPGRHGRATWSTCAIRSCRCCRWSSTAADAVTISIPDDATGPVGAVTVGYRGAPAVTVDAGRAGQPAGPGSCSSTSRSRASTTTSPPPPADSDDTPPRTYTQVTMRDEDARFSSRPGSLEDSTGDGYAFTLEAHRRTGSSSCGR